MNNVPEDRRQWRRAANEVQSALRDLNGHLVVLNHRVGTRVALRDVDLACLDLIARYGSISPSVLAKRAGMHPATMTGVLDRLERNGWVVRERDPEDRRAVVVRVLPDRGGELFRLYSGMRASMNDICAGYDTDQLTLIRDFLNRVAGAGERSADGLADEAAAGSRADQV
ncbi:MAG: MarR family transcriptional regulator [Actinophytocola sp.]|uniref:MarR family transcriptional regulator n=1 Tax=Actinophytocola sp. TaxID=1872138 RepID=UPI0013269B8C|nr:MarR family transcriptional regulator [Actinophytocola sp.]MPZ80674.1 MarR family transcriptional regulator [Actinophytocola sp.]